MKQDPVLADIDGLTVEVDGQVLVDRVGLRIRPGTVTALVGASGSGKTTTGLALLGEYPAGARVTGEVVVHGRIGFIPQHPASVLNPARRVGALLRDMARQQVRDLPRTRRRAAARQRVAEALADAQLPDAAELLRRYPHQLSGGQQQRVVLAQALLLGARVLVADEPTTGQDALTKRRVVDQLASVARRGIAVLLLSHDLDVVRELADEVVVMRGGRVVEKGPAHKVLENPVHPWTRELLAEPRTVPYAEEGRAGTEVLRVDGLVAHHGAGGSRVPVLRVAGLTLRTGECLAVVGRSGSGKTTLARCLAGLHRDHRGQVLLDGEPLPRSLRDRSREQLAAVQYVFQDARAAFDGHRPVLDQVARTAVRLRGAGREEATAEARRTLADLGLGDDLVRRLPGLLSGGELQRAALARALLARPRVLVCDEITSGLDPVTRRSLLDLLTVLVRQRDGLCVVLITHDLDTAAPATRIAVLDGGEVVEVGDREQILTAPRHPFTVALLRASTRRGSAVRP
ncbi:MULTISPECIES: ABC transporter ATP-binding protein [Streptomyces]|uniref:Peptide/nickel transport system ATP-binding protein n=1 Tax=Streptomyces clavifer TaxID=68188 RepID=A0ABS4VK73_9ACTN|nr:MULTISPECIES: ATP-binding cassette domain-containing protein [Streptomyces]KQX83640.1 peptide ABC transporter ATP-binding protein [Streptomyces sp. Root1319]KQZ03083.1 peptide ABC transporter ATP-binding protein [Streptomyces sp. Root55]MBP2364196.1 peptide/nickel transport system ATP-binding protein [Streptomyces clavifer]MDX2744381.1 ATP-binding cassette domain-containing protein [Streptomyces sp. NRRL_B-2557]MDX3065193.1 ATP-binding cassette domain-containing protein [Streptomyces sp. ND